MEHPLHGLENITQSPNLILKERLAGFKDLVIQDSTVIRVHENLARKWPVIRSKKVAAGVKVGLLISTVDDSAKRVMLRGECPSEVKTLWIGPWIKDRMLRIDLGFYKELLVLAVGGYGSRVSYIAVRNQVVVV